MEGLFIVAYDDQSQQRGLQQSDFVTDARHATDLGSQGLASLV